MKQSVAKLGTILGIWAHPDDEVWASGALMAAAVANGQTVVCVTATDGAAGQTSNQEKWPRSSLARVRRQEIEAAMKVLGISDLEWLGYEDGKLQKVEDEAAVARLVEIINEVQPDTILTFEPKGITGHPDHKKICQWVCTAAKLAEVPLAVYGACETRERYEDCGRECDRLFNMYYGTVSPAVVAESEADLVFRANQSEIDTKLLALRAHHSQTEQFFQTAAGQRYMDQLCAVECFTRLQAKTTFVDK